MASTYSTSLKLELQATGENAGTWGDNTNNNLNLITDKIFINMLTGNIKLEMKNNFDKVKLITNYELAN